MNLFLSTLSNENELVHTSKVSGLHVTGYKSDKGINLGPVFSRLSIPVNRGHIPTFDKIKYWSHLQFLRSKLSPELDCPVRLIIGYDHSDALASLFTTPSVYFGSYAQCTKLVWGVVGCVGRAHDSNGNHNNCTLTYQVFKPNGYSVSHHSAFCFKTCVKQDLSPWDMSMLLEQDFKDCDDADILFSVEDHRFLKLMRAGISQENGVNYTMPLPFKVCDKPVVPDNRMMAMTRLSKLRNRCLKDP